MQFHVQLFRKDAILYSSKHQTPGRLNALKGLMHFGQYTICHLKGFPWQKHTLVAFEWDKFPAFQASFSGRKKPFYQGGSAPSPFFMNLTFDLYWPQLALMCLNSKAVTVLAYLPL